jgi:hypothetical protein
VDNSDDNVIRVSGRAATLQRVAGALWAVLPDDGSVRTPLAVLLTHVLDGEETEWRSDIQRPNRRWGGTRVSGSASVLVEVATALWQVIPPKDTSYRRPLAHLLACLVRELARFELIELELLGCPPALVNVVQREALLPWQRARRTTEAAA